MAAAAFGLSLRRRRRLLLLLSSAAISGYGFYRLYHHPSITQRRRHLSRLASALLSLASFASSSADTLSLLSSDLNSFLRSDSDDLPSSLKQFSKISTSPEFTTSLSAISQSLTLGISRGISSSSPSTGDSAPSFSDRLLNKLSSPAGSGFVSILVGSFARNLVLGFYSNGDDGGGGEHWVNLICSDKSRELISDCIQRFVSTSVTVYLDKTLDINTYDEFFCGVTNPKHELKVRDLMVSVCNGAVETLVRTSHQVLSGSESGSSSKSEDELLKGSEKRSSLGDKDEGSSGWIDQVSATLAVPSNRKLVLDVTGRVTFETVRSFLEFMLWKLYDGTKRSVNAVCDGGLEVVRYISAKSAVVYTICLALCLHMFMGTKFLNPA